MPRSRIRQGKLAAQTISNGLIASARNLTLRSQSDKPVKLKRQEWQELGWYCYDVVEVFHYGVQWVGNTLSRATLMVFENGEPTTDVNALEVLGRFFGGADQHGEFLRQSAIHMTVPGEGYIIQQKVDNEDWWTVGASTEVKNGTTPGSIKFEGEELDEANSLVIRFWRPHPRKPYISDSPTRPLLPVLSQLEKLTKYVDAQLQSRLTGNGLMLFPSEMTFPSPITDDEGNTSQQGLNAFMEEWAKTMGAALTDQGSSAARVPTAMTGPADALEQVRHVTLWTPLDEHAPEMREEAVRRIALGMDMPPEALLGMGEANHWGAWQIDDSLIKSHAEPLLALLTEALTTDYLRVLLEEEYGYEYDKAKTFTIESDTANMRLRPNRSKESIELWDRGALSGAAMIRENGFEEADAMPDDEKQQWLLTKIAQGSPSPEFVQAAAKALGIEIDVPQDAETGGERPLPRSLEEHPKADPPERPSASAEILAASGEVAIFRALERAGNRLKSTGAKIEGIPSDVRALDRYQFVTLSRQQLNDVMTDAWSNLDRLTLPEGVDRAAFETALDNYTRMLISSRNPYDRSVLCHYLELALVRAA